MIAHIVIGIGIALSISLMATTVRDIKDIIVNFNKADTLYYHKLLHLESEKQIAELKVQKPSETIAEDTIKALSNEIWKKLQEHRLKHHSKK